MLEAVDVDEQDREHRSVASRLRDRVPEAVVEEPPVRQRRERVVLCEPAELLLALLERIGGALVLRDVLNDREEVARRAIACAHQRARDRDPYERAVLAHELLLHRRAFRGRCNEPLAVFERRFDVRFEVEIRNAHAQKVFARVSHDAAELVVDPQVAQVESRDGDADVRVVEHRTKLLLAVSERLLRLPAPHELADLCRERPAYL